jgi:hypothetical protein
VSKDEEKLACEALVRSYYLMTGVPLVLSPAFMKAMRDLGADTSNVIESMLIPL